MRSKTPKRRISYQDFANEVRRFPTSQLLQACASASIENYNRGGAFGGPPKHPDFALAAVAKASVIHGNDYRHTQLTSNSLRSLCGQLVNVDEPFVDDSDLRAFLLRTSYEQMPEQTPAFYGLARTRALLAESAAAVDQCTITPDFWQAVLSCSLDQLVGLAKLLHTCATLNQGVYDPLWFDLPNFAPALQELRLDAPAAVAEKNFVLDVESYKGIHERTRQDSPGLRRYEFNPLLVGPFVRIRNKKPIAPVLWPILYRATPGSLYYAGSKEAPGNCFNESLGQVFEHYVGRQLALFDALEVIPEIEFGRPTQRSVDYFVITERVVLLVEVKATPLTEASRLGGQTFDRDFARSPGKGFAQIERSAVLVRERHPEFLQIPADRTFLGLVVTLEPYYQVDSDLVGQSTDGLIPKLLCSSLELEALVSLEEESADQFLLDHVSSSEQSRGGLYSALQQARLGRNAVLDAAWASYPFQSGE